MEMLCPSACLLPLLSFLSLCFSISLFFFFLHCILQSDVENHLNVVLSIKIIFQRRNLRIDTGKTGNLRTSDSCHSFELRYLNILMQLLCGF